MNLLAKPKTHGMGVSMKMSRQQITRLWEKIDILKAEVKGLIEELAEEKKWINAYHTKAEDLGMSEVVPSDEEVERLDKEGHWAFCYECFQTEDLEDSCNDNRHTWVDEKRGGHGSE